MTVARIFAAKSATAVIVRYKEIGGKRIKALPAISLRKCNPPRHFSIMPLAERSVGGQIEVARYARNDFCSVVYKAVGTNVVRARAVAGDVCFAHACRCAELYGYFNANVLTYREYALPVLNAVAGVFPRRNHGLFATSCHRCARCCKGRYGNGYEYRRKLVCNGGAGLLIIYNIRILCLRKKYFRACALNKQYMPR